MLALVYGRVVHSNELCIVKVILCLSLRNPLVQYLLLLSRAFSKPAHNEKHSKPILSHPIIIEAVLF